MRQSCCSQWQLGYTGGDIFTAQRYASAVCRCRVSLRLCMSVRWFVTKLSRVLLKQFNVQCRIMQIMCHVRFTVGTCGNSVPNFFAVGTSFP